MLESKNINNDDEYYENLKSRQESYTKNTDTHKEYTFFSVGYTVVVQREDGGPRMLDVIVEGNSDNHQGQSYQMWEMKMLPYANVHTSYDPVLECGFISSSICMQPHSGLHLDTASQWDHAGVFK